MNNLSGKSVLFFCPTFFGYEKEIQKTLEGLGAKVIWFDDRPSNDFFSKSLIRINRRFLSVKTTSYYQKILSNLNADNLRFDYLLFVNPEAISSEILISIKSAFPEAKCILYMWDSFRNRKQNVELLNLFDLKFTFDPVDAESYGLVLRPLFYIDTYRSNRNLTDCSYDLIFIGTAHSDRYNLVKKITRSLNKNRLKLYFYLSSKLLFFAKKMIDKEFASVSFQDISYKSLTHDDIALMMFNSKAVLDINHPQQIGLTMRTLETLGAEVKLITTNSDIKKYDFYDPNNILLIDRTNPIIDADFFDLKMKKLSDEILFKYSVKGWAMEIFNIL